MLKQCLPLLALLAGCAAAPMTAPSTPAPATPDREVSSETPGTAPAASPTPSPKPTVGAPGSASYALARTANLGVPYFMEGTRNAAGTMVWKVLFTAGSASKAVTVTGEQVSSVRDFSDPDFKYKPTYGAGLGEVLVDSDAVLTKARAMGMAQFDRVVLLTAAGFKDRAGTASQHTTWRVEKSSSSYALDAVTGERVL